MALRSWGLSPGISANRIPDDGEEGAGVESMDAGVEENARAWTAGGRVEAA